MGTHDRVDAAARQLSEGFGDADDSHTILKALTRSAAVSIPGFDGASISVRENDEAIRTLAPTSELASQVDELQYELREGPCYDVIAGERFTVVNYMADDTQWPTFSPRATALGVGAMMSFELTDRPNLRAGLNLYSRQGGSLDANAVNIAELFAGHASMTLGLVEQIDQLESALRSRTVIGGAIGITMKQFNLTHDRAFGFLVRLSNDSNVKLRDIATRIVNDHDDQAR